MTWKTARLEEVAQVLGGGTPSRTEKSYFGGSIPWATPTDVTSLNGLYIGKAKETITDEGLKNSSTKLMPAGAVLLTSRATIGYTAVAEVPMCTNQGFVNFVCGPELMPEFLAYWLQTQKSKLIQHAGGTTFKEIARGTLRKFEIAFPPIAEQRRIVDILSRAEGIVRLRRDAEKKAVELIPALFLDMFGDPATNPKGWTTSPIVELCAVQTGGTPSRENAAYYEGEIPWVKTGEVAGGVITKTEEHISAQALAETNCKKFPVGTILVAMYGQGQTRGRCAVLGIEAATNQACAAIFPSDQIAGEFLFRLLQTQYEQLRSLAQGGNQANLNLSMIKSYRVIVPPTSTQHEFVERVNAVSSIQSQQAAATTTAQSTFDALLAQVFHLTGSL
ncbi:MAG: restriction endonuclease subunit S [Gallionella sp.]|nr:restriction endonuclease subunit S [Gallionella sp.]